MRLRGPDCSVLSYSHSHLGEGSWARICRISLSGCLCSFNLGSGHIQVGSLAGAAHLLKSNAGVLRPTQHGQKPCVEEKAKSWFDFGFQYEQKL